MDASDLLTVAHLLQENRKIPPSASLQTKAHIKKESDYRDMYKRSISEEEADAFWLEQAESLQWIKRPRQAGVYTWDSDQKVVEHTWFADGELNVSFNCLDRHLTEARRDKIAILWQGEKEEEIRSFTYAELTKAVERCANLLKKYGVRKGDRVCLYLPLIPELAIAMLACARLGAIHSIVFGGFSAESLKHRIQDSSCKLLITANSAIRGGKKILFKEIVDEALKDCPSIEKTLVVRRLPEDCAMLEQRDVWYEEALKDVSSDCLAEPMRAEDPLFILYTSGSTGKPKGVVHTQAGYLLHVSLSHRYIFDLQEQDIYWCTADIGWITGHSYVIYGPLANGATTFLYEGTPLYPHPDRFWQLIEKYKISIFYTAPTVIRSLIQQGDQYLYHYDLRSLRLLGSVGEPINPEAWMWYYEKIGQKRCPVIDTWWQTETGGVMIAPFPGFSVLKPGSASLPFFGVDPILLRQDGSKCAPGEGGNLCIKKPWPGIMRTTWNDHARFVDVYFTAFKNVYFSGDGGVQDDDGDYWLLGRIDDVVNISGHRIGTAEVESALVSHPFVAEAAVVPFPHSIKGQGLFAYVILKSSFQTSEALIEELRAHVKKEIGSLAVPDNIQCVASLPKTRSGKIMRRILRKIAAEEFDDLGDISTLADPQAVQDLIRRQERNG